jgi:nucleoside-diphosphate-sugar epimerase
MVTGAAGFIGSHLTEELARSGWEVRAIDSLTDYYDRAQKRANLAEVLKHPRVEHLALDLRVDDLRAALDGVDAVFHQAGQPGVRASWDQFQSYVDHNVVATHRLLDAVRDSPVARLVYASSSSVYGDAAAYPTLEGTVPNPQSPYGVTKLAAEHLCGVYGRNFGVPVVSLRYFTVYGPRQRPDMAMHRLIEAALSGEAFPMYGDGSQVRDFTFVSDVVRANVAAAGADVPPGTVVNIAGGGAVTLAEVVSIVEAITGSSIRLERRDAAAGDVGRTGGGIEAARRLLGWSPEVSVPEGLARQVDWHRARDMAAAGFTAPRPA